jgi:hypothetical protein
MLTEQTDYLQIDVVDYVPIKNPDNNNIVSSPGSRRNKGKNKSKTILLPIPSNISDTNAARYGSSELNSIAGAAIGGIADLMTNTGGALGGSDGGGITAALAAAGATGSRAIADIGNAAGGLKGLQGFATRQLAAQAAGLLGANITPDQLLARTTGEILNPNMELLFNGPTLRSFRFSFKMTPRNDTEAGQIKKIIRCLKQSMAPKVSSAGDTINSTFLKTPNVFELRYRQGVEEHQFLNKFKQCFLENISVNYTADGVYSTYGDGTPVSMIMDLSFKEIEPVYNIDYDDNLSGVGY